VKTKLPSDAVIGVGVLPGCVFDPDTIHEAAMKGVGLPTPAMLEAIVNGLQAAYPGKIDRSQPWLFSNSGGAMIQMKLLYASARELVMLFGSPVGTCGHSGRHRVDFYDTFTAGEVWYYGAGQLDRTAFGPGDRAILPKGQAVGFFVPDHFWGLEYARGPLGTMFPFGLADSFTSTLDVRTVAAVFKTFAKLNLRSLLSR